MMFIHRAELGLTPRCPWSGKDDEVPGILR